MPESNDPFLSYDKIMELLFDDKKEPDPNFNRLENLLNSNTREKQIEDLEMRGGKKLKEKDKHHLRSLLNPEEGHDSTDPEKYHRNAIVHSGQTLQFILKIKRGGTPPPPPWVC
ncbi:MAG: hypothetical protein HY707_05925 [Ignavibacteriae bacterium]|nr:hypothetical protein [Ignavibacteriota bacterium]